jgi:imidazolonepropionase-like amidohydrolase
MIAVARRRARPGRGPDRRQVDHMSRIVLRGGVVFDGTGAAPFRADLAIEGERIAELGSDLEGDAVIEVTSRAVLPGLIDCHSHVSFGGTAGTDELAAASQSRNALASVARLRATLEAGVTTVRDGAGADAGYRDAIAAREVPGPRLLVSLVQLSPSAGPYDSRTPSGLDTWVTRPGIPNPVADGEDRLRAKVRELAQLGADVVKIFATGHMSMARGGAHRSMFRDAELAAIVDEAQRQGLRVMAHAHGARGAEAAARAGVASIEHGFFLDEPALDAIAAADAVFVPTLMASEAAGPEYAEAHREVVRRAHARGIRIAMGSDCPMQAHGRNLRELELLVTCGLSPTEALVAGTSTAASLLGLDGELGQLRPGACADVVVVDGDPLVVEGLAERVRDVYRSGDLLVADGVLTR